MCISGATFDENDETITHQLVDRPSLDKQYISRYYVQPQWVFDSVNKGELLPEQQYFMGAVLPPHLSPFIDPARDQQYIPPEERAPYDQEALEAQHLQDQKQIAHGQPEAEAPEQAAKMSVSVGEVHREVPWEASRQERQEYRLREKMVKKKHKKLYKSMMEGKTKRAKEIWLLRKKRRLHDQQQAH